MNRPARPLISVVIPALDEADGLERLHRELGAALETLACPWEVILVDDGSRDATAQVWRGLMARDRRLGLVSLTRNFGKEAALVAGFARSRGDVVVPLDADLQDPPAVIGEFLARWRAGYDVVYGVRRSRRDPLWKRCAAAAYYRLIGRLADVEIPRGAGDFRLIDRAAIDDLMRLPETCRYTKGLFAWVGRSSCAVAYDRPARAAGAPKQHLGKLVTLAIDGITGFSPAPLHGLLWLGAVACLGAVGYAAFLVIHRLTGGATVPGYASTLCLILFFGGLNMAGIGLIGEYVARIYREVKRRPLYLERTVEGAVRGAIDVGDERAALTR
ncbi:MAG TPA: glycosyltransferase family 2 protein [Planctomycetota bacterium]|nr:glycosyltransferase family 2 protein [Planctomycetota bacterium]